MKTIRTNAQQVISENFKQVENSTTIANYAELEAQSDPGFYRWLFNDENISDFGSNLTNEEIQTALDFFATL